MKEDEVTFLSTVNSNIYILPYWIDRQTGLQIYTSISLSRENERIRQERVIFILIIPFREMNGVSLV